MFARFYLVSNGCECYLNSEINFMISVISAKKSLKFLPLRDRLILCKLTNEPIAGGISPISLS